MATESFNELVQRLQSFDEEERKQAVLDLLKSRDPMAISPLAKVVSEDPSVEVRYYARKAFYLLREAGGMENDGESVNLPNTALPGDLERLLQDGNPKIRFEGIKLALSMPPADVIGLIRLGLKNEKTPQLTGSYLVALGRLGDKTDIETLATFLKNPDSRLRANAIEALATIGGDNALVKIIPCLQDEDNRAKTNAVKALQSVGGAELLRLLRAMAKAPQAAMRDSAIFTLEKFRNPATVKILQEVASSDPVEALRKKAQEAVARMTEKDGVPSPAPKVGESSVLPSRDGGVTGARGGHPPQPANRPDGDALAGLPSKDGGVPANRPDSDALAGQSLDASTKDSPEKEKSSPKAPSKLSHPDDALPTRKSLPDDLKSKRSSIQHASDRPLKKAPVFSPAPELLERLKASETSRRQSALVQIAETLEPGFAACLMEALEVESEPFLISQIVTLLGRTKAPEAFDAVVDRLKDFEDRVRANAIEAAMSINPDKTLDKLSPLLTDSNNRVKANAILACCRKPGFDPLPWTTELAENAQPNFRRSAVYVISLVENQKMMPLLEKLLTDGDGGIQRMAYRTLQDYCRLKIPGATDLDRKIRDRIKPAGDHGAKFENEFEKIVGAIKSGAEIPVVAFSPTEESVFLDLGKAIKDSDLLSRPLDQEMTRIEEEAARLKTMVTQASEESQKLQSEGNINEAVKMQSLSQSYALEVKGLEERKKRLLIRAGSEMARDSGSLGAAELKKIQQPLKKAKEILSPAVSFPTEGEVGRFRHDGEVFKDPAPAKRTPQEESPLLGEPPVSVLGTRPPVPPIQASPPVGVEKPADKLNETKESLKEKVGETSRKILKSVEEAPEKIKGKVSEVTKAVAAVNWKQKFLFTFQLVILGLILYLHLHSTFDNLRNYTGVKFFCLLCAALAGGATFLFFRFPGPGYAAMIGGALLVPPLAYSGILLGGANVKESYVFLGLKNDFWANLACVAGAALPFICFQLWEIPKMMKIIFGVIIFYCSISSIVGTFLATPLEVVILGPGFLRDIPFNAQPGFIFFLVLIPLLTLFAGVYFIAGLAGGEKRKYIPRLAAVILYGSIFILGTGTLDRNMMPNLMSAVRGRKLGKGYGKTYYYHDYSTNVDKDHRWGQWFEVYTKTTDPTVASITDSDNLETDYIMAASVHPPDDPDDKTMVRLTVRDKTTKSDIVHLKAEDLTVVDDEIEQTFTLRNMLEQQQVSTANTVVICIDSEWWWHWHHEKTIQGLKAFIKQMNGCYNVKILRTDREKIVDVTNGFLDETAKLLHLIDQLDRWYHYGGQSMLESIIQACQELDEKSRGTGIIVCILSAEMKTEAQTRKLEEAIEAVQKRNIQLFILGDNQEINTSKDMRKLAEAGRGEYFNLISREDFIDTCARVFDRFSCRYEMSYQKKWPAGKGPTQREKSKPAKKPRKPDDSSENEDPTKTPKTVKTDKPQKEPALPKAQIASPEIKLIRPSEGAELSGAFSMKAKVKGSPRSVEFYLDDIPLKSFSDSRDGTFEHTEEKAEDYKAGNHKIIAKVVDKENQKAQDTVNVVIKHQLPEISIICPPNGSTVWKDSNLEVRVNGKSHEKVNLLLDGKMLKAYKSAEGPEFKQSLKVKELTEGMHVFKVQAIMPDGVKVEDMSNFKVVFPKPAVKISTPPDNKPVFGKVSVTLDCESGWKETKLSAVRLLCGEAELIKFSDRPYQFEWNTDPVPVGSHSLKAVAENEIGEIAEHKISVQVIKPKFFFSFGGVADGQELRASATGTVTIVNEQPGTSIEKIDVTLDGQTLKTFPNPPYEFGLDVFSIKPGDRELRAEAFRSDGKTFSQTCRLKINPPQQITLYFSVKDDKGKFVPTGDLQKTNLEILEDGKKVKDFRLTSAAALPCDFGIILDVSGSMQAERKLEKAKEAASAFVDLLKSNDRAFLMRFSDAPELVANLTNDRRKLQQEIEFLIPQRGTALYDSVFKGIEISSKMENRPALVLLTDGVDENNEGTGPGSSRSLQEVLEFGRTSDVQIFTIGLGKTLKLKETRGEKVLRDMANFTGGTYFFAPTPGELEMIFGGVIKEVGSQSKLSFVPPSGGNDGNWHKIEITTPSRKDLSIIYKSGYQAK